MREHRADELERFKREINLVEYAEAQGYEIDWRESSRASVVMRRGDDKIVVATDTDGHGIYFSVRDDRDNGSIIDFVQRRQGLNLGQVRKELRPWIGGQAQQRQRQVERRPAHERPRKPEPSSADRRQVLAAYMKMKPCNGRHPYLEQQRGIDAEILAEGRFVGMVRIDARGNAVFPHYDRDGLTGYELKNDGFTGFSKHGQKSIWYSSNLTTARRVVLVESAIDAMSHAQITGDRDAAYLSIGGSMSDQQRELVRSALARAAERGAEIVIGTDADAGGDRLAQELQALAPVHARVRRERPEAKDWNDVLQIEIEREQERNLRLKEYGIER